MDDSFRLSVAIPLYNEEDNLPELLRRLRPILDGIEGGPHEIVLVDDGSSDRTAEIIGAAAATDPRIVSVHLSRNFGHQAALTAALDYVTGHAVVLMDGDLQDPPEEIPRFLDRYREGYEVVYARRERRKEAWWLRLAYYLFYRIASGMSRLDLPLDAGDFCLMSRRVVAELQRTRERHRYLRGLRSWAGFAQTGIRVERASRHSGESKYHLSHLFGLAFDGIFSFSVVPLRAVSALGAAAVALTGVYALYAVGAKLLMDQTPQGFTALIVVITFVSGVHLFFLGVIGEYVGRVYQEVKSRPLYVVEEIRGRNADTTSRRRVHGGATEPSIAARD